MRISHWSSDVCSSDLRAPSRERSPRPARRPTPPPIRCRGAARGRTPTTTPATTRSTSRCASGGKVAPSAAIGLPAAVAAIKEDSTDNVVEFSASAENLTDELTSIVIELPNVAGGDVYITTINTALIGIGSASVTEAGGTTTITITFDDADNVQSFNSSFTLDAPVEDSDVDLTGVKITANAKDITSGVTGSDSATTTIVVDAVLDDAGQATQAAAPSVAEPANAQEIDLDLSLGFVSAGFGLSGAGDEDTDGSEAIPSVQVTIAAGTLALRSEEVRVGKEGGSTGEC